MEEKGLDKLLAMLAKQPAPAWFNQDADCVLFVRLRLHANLAGRAFASRLSEADRIDLRQRFERSLWPDTPPAWQGELVELDNRSWEFSSERWLQEPLHPGHGDARYYLNKDENQDWLLLAEDHLRISLRGTLDAVSEQLPKALQSIESVTQPEGLARDNRGALVCAHPFLCGAGAQLTLVLHLPACCWWGRIEDLLDPLYRIGFCYRTWQEGYGDFLLLENTSAENHQHPAELIKAAQALLPGIIAEENACRRRLAEHRRQELEDRIHRALALCQNARQMGYPELVEHLSMLRLARQLADQPGWSLPPLTQPVTQLLMKLAPAHLALKEPGIDARQSMAARARELRAALRK